MELRDIEVFLVVAEEPHFGRAAQWLNLTGGRVSQTVRVMERGLGGPLFTHGSQQVRLTALGKPPGRGQ